jgi:hypothetical protein
VATNPSLDYGLDVACISDADDMFTEVSGVDLVAQDALHLITSDDFLGPGGDSLGFDARRLIGLNTDELIGMQSVLEQILENDDRILRAVVTLTATTRNGLADVVLEAICETEHGPFALTKSIGELTEQDLEGQAGSNS